MNQSSSEESGRVWREGEGGGGEGVEGGGQVCCGRAEASGGRHRSRTCMEGPRHLVGAVRGVLGSAQV